MAKRAARRFPHPYGLVFEQVVATPPDASERFEVIERDRETGLVEIDAWFTASVWGERIALCVVPEGPSWTRVEIEVSHKHPVDFGSRRGVIERFFEALDDALPGGEDVDVNTDVPPAALADEQPDPNVRWQVDRLGDHELRYWDGHRFTEHVADGGVRSIDAAPER